MGERGRVPALSGLRVCCGTCSADHHRMIWSFIGVLSVTREAQRARRSPLGASRSEEQQVLAEEMGLGTIPAEGQFRGGSGLAL